MRASSYFSKLVSDSPRYSRANGGSVVLGVVLQKLFEGFFGQAPAALLVKANRRRVVVGRLIGMSHLRPEHGLACRDRQQGNRGDQRDPATPSSVPAFVFPWSLHHSLLHLEGPSKDEENSRLCRQRGAYRPASRQKTLAWLRAGSARQRLILAGIRGPTRVPPRNGSDAETLGQRCFEQPPPGKAIGMATASLNRRLDELDVRRICVIKPSRPR